VDGSYEVPTCSPKAVPIWSRVEGHARCFLVAFLNPIASFLQANCTRSHLSCARTSHPTCVYLASVDMGMPPTNGVGIRGSKACMPSGLCTCDRVFVIQAICKKSHRESQLAGWHEVLGP
jgi:hypothetical protein